MGQVTRKEGAAEELKEATGCLDVCANPELDVCRLDSSWQSRLQESPEVAAVEDAGAPTCRMDLAPLRAHRAQKTPVLDAGGEGFMVASHAGAR